MMNANPFRVSEPLLQTPLSDERCQHIHARALHRAAQGYLPAAVPEHIRVEHLQQQITRKGADVCFLHPTEVSHVFTGVTLAVYQSIEMLYCDRVGRSIMMVWKVLTRIARSSGVKPITYEAVWSICIYLERQRHIHTDVSIERGQEAWWIGTITLDLCLQDAGGDVQKYPYILCVVNMQKSEVLTYQYTFQDTVSLTMSLALYNALLSQRRPHQQAQTGVLWHIPKQIITTLPSLSDSRAACTRLHIPLSTPVGDYLFPRTLQTIWTSAVVGKVLAPLQCMRVLDRSLEKMLGSGPIQVQTQHEQDYAYLSGYAQEPDWIFPLVRAFLPQYCTTVTPEGVIEYDGLHYTDDLLEYFVDQPITVRRPLQTEAHLWVYLEEEEEILCRAMARELRRRDGTYRQLRLGR